MDETYSFKQILYRFDQVHIVTGISTQGRLPGGNQFGKQYVTRYKMRYSDDCVTFYTYRAEAGNADVCYSLRNNHFKIVGTKNSM